MAELTRLEAEIAELRASVSMSEYHDRRRRLQAANTRLNELGEQEEELVWSLVPSATADWAAEFEAAPAEASRILAKFDGLASYAYSVAHEQRNGRDPQLHPAHRTSVILRRMTVALSASIGAGAQRDPDSGPALVAAVQAGIATTGDITRWTPPSAALPDGTTHLNRGEPA